MPLTVVLLAEQARRGARALPSLSSRFSSAGAAVPSSDAADALHRRHHGERRSGARGAATDAGPPRKGTGTVADEDQRRDTYGAMPASPGGQPEAVPKEALQEAAVASAEATPAPGAAVDAGAHRDDAGVRAAALGSGAG
jgi:hypothetical protein